MAQIMECKFVVCDPCASAWGNQCLVSFQHSQGKEIFLLITAFSRNLGPYRPLIQWLLDSLTLGYSDRNMQLNTKLRTVTEVCN